MLTEMTMMDYDIAVIGAGPAGMMAAGQAARLGKRVCLIEKNEKVGRKLAITGKGRCNVTNACSEAVFLEQVPVNPKFLYSAIGAFTPQDTMDFFAGLGVSLKVERGRRVFPQSDRAYDIVDAMRRFVRQAGVKIVREQAGRILAEKGAVRGVKLCSGEEILAPAVILATGGASYPLTGSTGDGYRMARELGHTVNEIAPSLVPIETEEDWCREVMGLSLKHVVLRVIAPGRKKPLFEELGEMLFTHFGVSGPLVISASSHMRHLEQGKYRMEIDLKPGLDDARLEMRLLRDFEKYANKDLINALGDLLPRTLIPVMIGLCGLDPHQKVNQITKEQRRKLIERIKRLPLTPRRFRPLAEAIITSGGIKVGEVSPATMASKLIDGLFFAGEILDVDAYTGGYNLQIAFSTGYLAGVHAAYLSPCP